MSAWTDVVVSEDIPGWYMVVRSVGHYHADTGGDKFTPFCYGTFRDKAEAIALRDAIAKEEERLADEAMARWSKQANG